MSDMTSWRFGRVLAAGAAIASVLAIGAVATALAEDLPTLKLLAPFGGTVTQDGVAAVTEKLNETLGAKIGAHIELSLIPFGDYDQRMTLVNAAREPYDIAMTAPWINKFATNVANGNFVDLGQYFETVPELRAAVSKELLSVGMVGGKSYGVPIVQEFPKSFGFGVRTDIADKYGLDPETIKSWSDLTPYFEAIVKGEGEGFYAFGGGLTAFPELFGYDPVVSGFANYAVVKMDDPARQVVNLYASDEYRALMKLRRSWAEAGLTDPNPMTKDAVRAALKAGTEAFTVESTQDRPSNRLVDGRTYYTHRFAPLTLTTAAMNASMMAVSADSKHPVEAIKLIALLHSDPEVLNLFAYGVEGINWRYVTGDSGLIEIIDAASYGPGVNWMWGNSYLAHPLTQADIDAVAESKKVNAAAQPSVVLGFAFDSAPVQNQIASLSAIDAKFQALEAGSIADVDGYIDGLLNEQKAAGLEAVQAEVSKQIAAWAAASQQ